MKRNILFLITAALVCASCMFSSCEEEKDSLAKSTKNEGVSDVVASNGDTIRVVDLGLPSGTLWADRNIGAKTLYSPGVRFAFGERETKDLFAIELSQKHIDSTNYKWETYMCSRSACGTYTDPIKIALGDLTDIGGTQFDAATVKWGSEYRMPSMEHFKELWCFTIPSLFVENGKTVIRCTSIINGNSIYFPYWAAHKYFVYVRDPFDRPESPPSKQEERYDNALGMWSSTLGREDSDEAGWFMIDFKEYIFYGTIPRKYGGVDYDFERYHPFDPIDAESPGLGNVEEYVIDEYDFSLRKDPKFIRPIKIVK